VFDDNCRSPTHRSATIHERDQPTSVIHSYSFNVHFDITQLQTDRVEMTTNNITTPSTSICDSHYSDQIKAYKIMSVSSEQ